MRLAARPTFVDKGLLSFQPPQRAPRRPLQRTQHLVGPPQPGLLIMPEHGQELGLAILDLHCVGVTEPGVRRHFELYPLATAYAPCRTEVHRNAWHMAQGRSHG